MEKPKDSKGPKDLKGKQYFSEMKIEEQELCLMNYLQSGGEGKALLSYWQYSQKTKDFDCKSSTVIFQPVPFKDMNYFTGKTCQRTFMFRGHNQDIFWFSLDDKSSMHIYTLSKSEGSNPESSKISDYSFLYKHMKEGNYVLSGDKSFENPVPNLITDSSDKKLCVFAYTSERSPAPTVYFYDLES